MCQAPTITVAEKNIREDPEGYEGTGDRKPEWTLKSSPPGPRPMASHAPQDGGRNLRGSKQPEPKGKEREEGPVSSIRRKASDGLSLIRTQMAGVVNIEKMRLQQARHDYYRNADNLSSKLQEEKEKLKFFERKLLERSGTYDRLQEAANKANIALTVAKSACNTGSTKHEQMMDPKLMLTSCEVLVNSWSENLELSRERLHSWEFRCRRQTEIVAKLQADLSIAEGRYANCSEQFDYELDRLSTVSDLLRRL